MRIVFSGGANEVGASCYLVQIDGKNLLLDCGVRMKGSDILPDLRRIQELGGVDAILVSHAHLDHTGALPIIHREYPGARLFMTHATKDLTRVLLYDSLKIMERREAEIPLYAEGQVLAMLEQSVCYSPLHPFKPFLDEELTVTFFSAGHILGAVLIYIQGREGSLLYTGDLALTDQRTVPRAAIPKLRPDVLIMESTYGQDLHSNREVEEERLISAVANVVTRGGKVLFPAFALGRAQELILILQRAMSKKQLPLVPVYVDGMVRAVNRVYEDNPNYLRAPLARKVFRDKEIFYNEQINPVHNPNLRQQILEQKGPLCIIASSGMLKGGPSVLYAKGLAGEERNLIGITGFQDEESPGYEILSLLNDSKEERTLALDTEIIPLKCELARFGLSAHADKNELLGFAHHLTPQHLYLVHGDPAAILALGTTIQSEHRGRVYAPANGSEYDLELIKPRKQQRPSLVPSLQRELSELTEPSLAELRDYLCGKTGAAVGYPVEDLLRIWSGTEGADEADQARLRGLLNSSPFFSPNPRQLFLFQPVEDVAQNAEGPMETNEMLSIVKGLFPPEAGLYKVGARLAEKEVLLFFNFPQSAVQEYSHLIEQIQPSTGWKTVINENCNQGAARLLLNSLLGETVKIKKFSFFPDPGYFQAELGETVQESEKIAEEFTSRVGLELRLSSPNQGGYEPKPQGIRKFANPMEQNQALAYIDTSLADLGVDYFKRSVRKHSGITYIELSFLSPQIGAGYQKELDQLSEDIGISILIGDSVNQNALMEIAHNLCQREGISLAKNPSVFLNRGTVRLTLSSGHQEFDQEELIREYLELTGFKLEFA